jgi:hypothetical protein
VESASRPGWRRSPTLASGLRPARALVEIDDEQASDDAAVAAAAAIEERLAGLGPQLHHGMGPATWAVLRAAKGHDTRIGLEDVLTLPGGEPAPGNAALVAYAARGSSST